MDFRSNEPPIDPLADTHPTQTFPAVNVDQRPSTLQRIIGLLLLLGAAAFTFGTVVVLVLDTADEGNTIPFVPTDVQATATVTDEPAAPTIQPTQQVDTNNTQQTVALAPLDPDTAASLLQQPLVKEDPVANMRVERDMRDPFTIIPDRPRNEIIIYEAVQGDTIDGIAQRFGLESESIAWSNDRSIVQVLRPGDQVNIPPVDGVLVQAIGSQRTVADYATQYKVDDPRIILDSEFNDLAGFSPETIPPSGTQIFIPGGEAEEIVWTAAISISDEGGSPGGTAAGAAYVRFQPGDPGDCGPQEIVGGSFWTNPIPSGNYFISRGYSSWHTGIDLARQTGIPIAAANGGRVIFAGWNSFGYGYMVALIHGPNMTVYGHLSEVHVICGQDVVAGQIIGAMGSSGNSSGPHLHFEIRSRSGNTYAPYDPSSRIGF